MNNNNNNIQTSAENSVFAEASASSQTKIATKMVKGEAIQGVVQSMTDPQPLIFTKKVNKTYKKIPLSITNNTLGPNRHFPSSTKEWLNSIYTYNTNSLKNLSVADKNLTSLIKSYLNLYHSKRVLKDKRIALRFRRVNLNRIFVGKPELKHTNNKVIITLYVYNEQKRLLNKQIKEIKAKIFPLINWPINNKYTVNKGIFRVQKLLKSFNTLDFLNDLQNYYTNTIKLENENLLTFNISGNTVFNKKKLFLIEELERQVIILNNLIDKCQSDEAFNNFTQYTRDYLQYNLLGKDIANLNRLKMLLDLNNSKFEDNSLLKLKYLVKKIYNKEIEFNIINLKHIYLDSSIFTEAMAIKLKNRDNRILTVLRTCINMVKFPKLNKEKEKYGKPITNQKWANKMKNMFVFSNVNNVSDAKNNKDLLNEMLLDIMPNFSNSNTTKVVPSTPALSLNGSIKKNPSKVLTIQGHVLNALKDKYLSGVRLEARGRLTRRFTASRSVFKVKWIGSLQTLNSSYKGLSSVVLRGHARPNVQYTLTKNKTRNGAFGLRGWISSK